MNLQTVIVSIAIIAVIAVLNRRRNQEEETQPEIDTADFSDTVKALSALMEQLENADRMIADLNACSPSELLRGFHANWYGIDGKQRHIDFIADGQNQATAGLKAAAIEQRTMLNREIIDAIRTMNAALDAGCAPALSLDVVSETVSITTADANAGEG